MLSIFRSMRWRLQLWYAGVLLLVIGSAGTLVYWQSRVAKLGEIDTKLQAAAQYLDVVLRSFPRGELDEEFRPRPGRPRPDGPPPRFRPDGEGRPPPPFPPPPRRPREELFN
jgi:hypothetical protein